MGGQITIRQSTDADLSRVASLAELDSRRAPGGDLLLGFVDGELRAAVDLTSGVTVADPFHPTAELVELLRMSAGQPGRLSGFGLRPFRHAAQAA